MNLLWPFRPTGQPPTDQLILVLARTLQCLVGGSWAGSLSTRGGGAQTLAWRAAATRCFLGGRVRGASACWRRRRSGHHRRCCRRHCRRSALGLAAASGGGGEGAGGCLTRQAWSPFICWERGRTGRGGEVAGVAVDVVPGLSSCRPLSIGCRRCHCRALTAARLPI